jgi:hypothetical protein
VRRQLIKRHVMLEEDVDVPRKVIKRVLLALAGAALVALVHIDGYRLGEVRVEVLRLFLCKRISCDDCDMLALVRPYCELVTVLQQPIPSKACSTFTASFALVSKYGIPPLAWQNACALFELIILLLSSTSTLLPSTTNGKLSGSIGLAWIRNSSRHESRVSKDLELLTS